MKSIGPAIVIGAIVLGGCSKGNAPRSYDFFKTHPAERAGVVRKCRHGDGNYQYEPQAECSPAFNAEVGAQRAHDLQKMK